MSKTIIIGVMGGSFNPPHEGHLHISNIAIKRFGLNKLLWLVSPQNPIKSLKPKYSFEERIELCKELAGRNPKIEVSNLEKKLSLNSKKFYTYNFLKRFKTKFPEYRVKLILGADNLVTFHKWYRYKEILKLAELVFFSRSDELGNIKYKALNSRFGKSGKYEFVNTKMLKISSSEIRK